MIVCNNWCYDVSYKQGSAKLIHYIVTMHEPPEKEK